MYIWLGLLSVIVATSILPVAMLDPALSGFAAWLAIVLAGTSSIGVKANIRYCMVSILISIFSVFVLAAYSPRGDSEINLSTFTGVLIIMAVPLIFAAMLISIGIWRRRRFNFSDKS